MPGTPGTHATLRRTGDTRYPPSLSSYRGHPVPRVGRPLRHTGDTRYPRLLSSCLGHPAPTPPFVVPGTPGTPCTPPQIPGFPGKTKNRGKTKKERTHATLVVPPLLRRTALLRRAGDTRHPRPPPSCRGHPAPTPSFVVPGTPGTHPLSSYRGHPVPTAGRHLPSCRGHPAPTPPSVMPGTPGTHPCFRRTGDTRYPLHATTDTGFPR